MDFKGKRILIVDDQKDSIDTLTEYLSQEGHSISAAYDGESALHRVRAWKPHLVLLDVNLPDTSGLELASRIRNVTPNDYVSIILVSGNVTLQDVTRGLECGADDYLTKPFRAQELLSRVRIMLRFKELQDNLRRLNHRVEELSSIDEISGLLNMKTLVLKGTEEAQRSRRYQKPISALLVDIDRFSHVNESTDFLFGTQILRDVGNEIRKCVRSIDLAARVGGDQFFILLPETDLAGAEFMAERIRDAVQKAEFRNDKYQVSLTAGVGVAGFSPDSKSRQDSQAGVHPEGELTELLRNTAESLRAAKSRGPNQIEIYAFL